MFNGNFAAVNFFVAVVWYAQCKEESNMMIEQHRSYSYTFSFSEAAVYNKRRVGVRDVLEHHPTPTWFAKISRNVSAPVFV